MDRLTGAFKGASMFATVEQARIYNRLRQYEDTGLTPDEIAALQVNMDAYATAARVIALHLDEFCDKEKSYAEMISDAARKARTQIAALRAENERLRAENKRPLNAEEFNSAMQYAIDHGLVAENHAALGEEKQDAD